MRWKITTSVLLVLVLHEACSGSPPSKSTIEMPGFTDELARDASDFDYRLAWTEDGYPGRQEPNGTIYAHPLYGVYALQDYFAQHKRRPTAQLERAIRRVAGAVLRRMRRFEGGLVFWYEATPDSARAHKRYYSALTQSYYAVTFHEIGAYLNDDRLKRAGESAFESVLIPSERGGVLFEDDHGLSVAEVPQEPNSYILNGWLSALYSISKYASLSGSQKAKDLVERSARTMIELLPLYDVERLANSRYGLTGFVFVKIVPQKTTVRIRSGKLTVPDEGSFDVRPMNTQRRWENYLKNDVQANVVMSLASYPEPNRLELSVESEGSGTVTLQAYVSDDFDPLRSQPTNEEWVDLQEFPVSKGAQTLKASLPWEKLDLVFYPTTFSKKIQGHGANIYHSIHVNQLKALSEATGIEGLKRWSDKWNAYMCRWKDMELYDDLWASIPGLGPVPVTRICD